MAIETISSSEILKEQPEIAVVTGTFYPNWYPGKLESEMTPDKLRGDLALQSIDSAISQGFKVCVVDGGSIDSFKEELTKRGVQFESQRESGGQGPARRQGLEMVSSLEGIKVICTTEPEKVSIINDALRIASQPILNGEADIVVPLRNETSLGTYPTYQASQESRANILYNRILRSRGLLKDNEPDIDFWIGPRIFANKPEVLDLFMKKRNYEPGNTELDKKIRIDMYSNPLFFPVVEALYMGMKIKSVEVPYQHPEIQTHFEEGNADFDAKRNTQRRTITTELIHLVRQKEGSPKTKLR